MPPNSPLFAVVVNDDPTQLNVLCGLIRKAGLEPHAFTGAEAALDAMLARAGRADDESGARPVLVVTDLCMPGIDGWRFCRLLRSPEYAACNHIPILVVSATFAGAEPDRIAAELGAEAFLLSPVDGPLFVEQVRAILSGKQWRIPLRVLIVEDSRTLAGVLEKAFAAYGYQADTAFTARAAAEAFTTIAYDVAVLDYHLPDGTGDTLLEAFRAERPDCVCIMMTTDPGPKLALDWMKQGAAAYLRKPFEPAYLIELCAKASRERALLRVQDLLELRTRQLRESETQYRLLADHMRDAVWLMDMSLKTTYSSPSVQRLRGYTPEEVQQLPLDQQLTPASFRLAMDALSEEIHRALADPAYGFARTLELEFHRKDGTTFWSEDTFSLIRDEGGLPVYILGEGRDITDRKRAEHILLDVIDNIPVSIQVVDKDGYVLKVNAAHTRLFGAVPPADYSIFNDAQLREQGFSALIERAKTGEIVTFPDIHYNAHNVDPNFTDMPVWIRMVIFPINDRHGNPERFVTMHDDITERKRADEALRESELKYRSLIECSSDAIFCVDEQGRYKFTNQRFASTFGKTPDDFLGKTFWDVYPKDHADYRFDAIQRVFRTGESESFDVDVPLPGKTLHFYSTTNPIRDETGKIVLTLTHGTDITERRQMEEDKRNLEERLQRAEKMEALGTLAGGVAHDLNNVLGIVVGYSEMLLDGLDPSNPLRHGLENVMSGGLKAAAIVDDLLTLARRGVPGRSILNLNRIVAACQQSPEFAEMSSRHSSIRITTDLEPDLLNISGSSVHLGKSLYNLVSNASEAMANGGGITIKTSNQYLDTPIQGYDQIREGDYVVLSVSDTGEGIQAADLNRIFEPFYTKKVMGRSGTGLGLAVVWGTVKDHHGYINVQSEEKKGSTFTLYFPVTREGLTTEAGAAAVSEYMGHGESILIVDDVAQQRDLAAGLLRTLTYVVSTVSSGEEAVAYMKEHEVDLVVLDMIMDPGMDGLDTYRGIIDVHPKQRAIIVSGFSESDRVRTARDLGAGAYVRKPYIKEKLGLAVRKELDRIG